MPHDQTNLLWPILGGVLIILTNAFFVTVEFAIVTVRRGQMERLAEEGNGSARQVTRLLRDTDWAIAGSQLGITVASILLGVVAEEPLNELLAPVLTHAFAAVSIPAGVAGGLATVLVLLLLSFFHMVIGEQTPKTIALRYPAEAALFIAAPMSLFARLASPLVWLVDRSTSVVLRLFGIKGETGGHGIHNVQELKDVVMESRQGGVIEAGEQQMLVRALEFSDRFVREAMIPRPDIVALEQDSTLGELLRVFSHERHSRFPVYDDDLDHIVGVLTMKEVLPVVIEDPSATSRTLAELDVIRPALVVPESRRIGALFNQMRRDRQHMAIVIDEYGGTAGLVTTEELAEEVVGRLTDEWVNELPMVQTVKEDVYDIDAQTRVDEMNELLGVDLPTSGDYETVAGFLLFQWRRIPKEGDSYVFDKPGPDRMYKFTVTKMDGPKIERVRVERA
jgi:CBS domain containing-hemolysin-like protein